MTTDIRFIHKNNGEVLEIEIAGTTYTPEQIRAALERASSLDREVDAQRQSASYLAGKLAEADTERLRARAWARSWKQLAKEYYIAYDEACDTEAAAVIVRDARIAELDTLRAALGRWRDADGTAGLPDADAEPAELARGAG